MKWFYFTYGGNKMKQKRKSMVLLASFCIVAIFAIIFHLITGQAKQKAQAATNQNVYTAFGDSIAAGYGLEGYSDDQTKAPKDSYQALVAAFLKTNSHNYAVTGDNSSDCIEILTSGIADEYLEQSDIITLSIGSNDLLLPFIYRMIKEFDIDPGSIDPTNPMPELNISSMSKYWQKLKQLLSDLSDDEELHTQAAAFPDKFQTILSLLKEKAPNAKIYVTNIYNPFLSITAIPELGKTADIYIKEINKAFRTDAADYTLVDVYTPFKENPAYTNFHVDLSNPSSPDISMDPHPSVKGHKKIAKLFTEAIQHTYAPKAASISQIKSSRTYKLTANVKLPKNADKYQLLYASSKNGTYKTLATATRNTYRTNNKKLKSNRTYYIKARSLRKINGVTYYGKDSKAYKLTIK